MKSNEILNCSEVFPVSFVVREKCVGTCNLQQNENTLKMIMQSLSQYLLTVNVFKN